MLRTLTPRRLGRCPGLAAGTLRAVFVGPHGRRRPPPSATRDSASLTFRVELGLAPSGVLLL